MLTIPEVPYEPIILRASPQGLELVGGWPQWVAFPLDGARGMAEPPLTEWQGFAWNRRGGYIEVRAHDQWAQYQVIDVVNRQLACRCLAIGAGV